MNRREFLIATGAVGVGAVYSSRGNAQDRAPVRLTETVDALDVIPQERRVHVAANPESKSPYELNDQVPEINVVELDNSLSDAAPGDSVRVIAWNIERGREWEGSLKLINEHPALMNPDIVLLSEMDLGMARSGNKHTTREMATALGMNFAYAVEFLELSEGRIDERSGKDFKNTYGYHGNAILSRFPLRNVRALRFPGIERWYGSGEHRLGGRNAVIADIEADGRAVTIVATHLESALSDGPIRLEQIGMIVDELEARAKGNPVIFGGDLNCLPKQPPVQALRDAGFDVDGANDLRTKTVQRVRDGEIRLSTAHIDYLAVRDLEVVADETSPAVVMAAYPPDPRGKPLSDHAAVTAKVQL